MTRRSWLVAAVGAAAVVTVVLLASRASSGGATRARPNAASEAAAAPRTVPPGKVRRPSAGLALRADVPDGRLDAAPGAAAFRTYTDDFVDAQAAVTREHMAREGLTMDETRELTYFAVLAVESQDWARVESLTGKRLSADERREAWEAMMARSQEMHRHMREEIARGADESTRWDVISRIERGYLSDYYRVTGMTPALLDQLLAASVEDQHVNETLASMSPSDDRPPVPGGGKRGVFVKRDPLNPSAPPVPVDEPPPP